MSGYLHSLGAIILAFTCLACVAVRILFTILKRQDKPEDPTFSLRPREKK